MINFVNQQLKTRNVIFLTKESIIDIFNTFTHTPKAYLDETKEYLSELASMKMSSNGYLFVTSPSLAIGQNFFDFAVVILDFTPVNYAEYLQSFSRSSRNLDKSHEGYIISRKEVNTGCMEEALKESWVNYQHFKESTK